MFSLRVNNVNEGASWRESGSVFQCAGSVVPKPRLPMDLAAGGTAVGQRKAVVAVDFWFFDFASPTYRPVPDHS